MQAARILQAAVPPLLALALASCGGDGKPAATQVAARVNAEEISVHQINHALSRAQGLTAEQATQAGKLVLERLIEQELLVQQAVDRKLDRDPRVLQALEASRREILARAYLDSVTADSARPDAGEVRKYFEDNPALFTQRRLYNLQELVVALPEERRDAFGQVVEGAKSFGDVVNWLRQENIPFTGNGGVKAAEQLPLELLPRLAQMKDGHVGLIRTAAGATVLHLAGSRPQPLTEQAAKPYIEQYLINRKKTQLAQAEIKRLREAARIEYAGDYAQPAGPAAPGEAPGGERP
jgi:EpsD family peptidyl-prolyl cis-trans isomerase